jgi:flagellar motor switch protein FliG
MAADDGVEKSAILLISLGEDYASEVLKHLGPKEVQKLGHAMAALKSVPRVRVDEVLAISAIGLANRPPCTSIRTPTYVRSSPRRWATTRRPT